MKKLTYILLLLLPLSATSQMAGVISSSKGANTIKLKKEKAFPSVMGHGSSEVTGGRGGKLFFVTSLDGGESSTYDPVTETYEGTLLAARKLPDTLTVLFRVSGTINATSSYYLDGNNNNYGHKTFVGASAPYPGIVITNAQWVDEQTLGNVIYRGMTLLYGDNGTPGTEDAYTNRDSDRVIFSDMTAGWAADESTAHRGNSVIVSNNVFLENHPSHNTGGIVGHQSTSGSYTINTSVHNNGYFHVSHRFANYTGAATDSIDDVNNFVYDYRARLNSQTCTPQYNNINNYYKKNRATIHDGWLWNATNYGNAACAVPNNSFYTYGNIIPGVIDSERDNRDRWNIHTTTNGFTANDQVPGSFFRDTPHPLGEGLELTTAEGAYQDNIVGKNIGARYYTDSNGKRVKYYLPFIEDYLDDAINGTTTAFRNDVTQFVVPALPPSGIPFVDADKDGMSDVWEDEQGLDSSDRLDGKQKRAFYVVDDMIIDNRKHDNYGNPKENEFIYSFNEIYWLYIQGDFEALKKRK